MEIAVFPTGLRPRKKSPATYFHDNKITICLNASGKFWWEKDVLCYKPHKRKYKLAVEQVLTHELLHAVLAKRFGYVVSLAFDMLLVSKLTISERNRFCKECSGGSRRR